MEPGTLGGPRMADFFKKALYGAAIALVIYMLFKNPSEAANKLRGVFGFVCQVFDSIGIFLKTLFCVNC
ncbi:MAG: hypothetical protein CR979_00490 [Propionibacterium sp.]|nr:MAG: hypothetical protein CR979_00490 [Propionibacterium sp.]